mgnify:CR=1 FL=1
MANRVVGNVIIIDSAMGNKFALQDVTGGNQISKFMVNAWAFYSLDSTGACKLTGANTSMDIYFIHDFPTGASNSIQNPKWHSFGQAQRVEDIKCPVVTAGTAFLYFV